MNPIKTFGLFLMTAAMAACNRNDVPYKEVKVTSPATVRIVEVVGDSITRTTCVNLVDSTLTTSPAKDGELSMATNLEEMTAAQLADFELAASCVQSNSRLDY
jgi:hypothetical protein